MKSNISLGVGILMFMFAVVFQRVDGDGASSDKNMEWLAYTAVVVIGAGCIFKDAVVLSLLFLWFGFFGLKFAIFHATGFSAYLLGTSLFVLISFVVLAIWESWGSRS